MAITHIDKSQTSKLKFLPFWSSASVNSERIVPESPPSNKSLDYALQSIIAAVPENEQVIYCRLRFQQSN